MSISQFCCLYSAPVRKGKSPAISGLFMSRPVDWGQFELSNPVGLFVDARGFGAVLSEYFIFCYFIKENKHVKRA